ncbi:acyl CoA:acetate/3-ketoacid CoA transferase [Thalassoglobus sp.]|uniref:acyl CoA:acetate/3-ketoacid CoA transferase n=1 Tax=Thalassoglobus sp. TaxID=2795869 RepID=UPI003AA98A6A
MTSSKTELTSLNAKLCSAQEAVDQIQDGTTIACGGFVGAGHPESLTVALEQKFLKHRKPLGLTLVYAAGQGDGKTRGLNHLAHPGLLKRVIGGHWGLCPRLGEMALAGEIEAYNFPQGVICHLYRDIAAGRPGSISRVGLGTFIDPQNCGGKLNDRTTEDLVERVTLRGQEWMFYHSFPIHVGMIRATAADPYGNLVMDDEAVIGDVLPIAQAAHNHGGIVIAQVKKLLEKPAAPQRVAVPGRLVTSIVLAEEDEHWQTFAEPFNADFCNPFHTRAQTSDQSLEKDSFAVDARRVIAMRACDELQPGAIANLGIGLPEGIAEVASQRGILSSVTLTVESGPFGGAPAGGLSFGASRHPEAIIDQPAQFDFYDGGGLDFAALGAAQVDQNGNVNVSRFGSRFAGVGGFVNISQNARRLVFCGTLTTGGLEVEFEDSQLRILSEGRIAKFVQQVQQVSFSGPVAREAKRDILFVTERAVFRMRPEGIELIEVAPGIDIQKDVVDQMEFEPIIRSVGVMKISNE